MKQKIAEWLNIGEGGEWYEPHITNRDLIYICIITLILSVIIIFSCWIIINI